MRSFVCVTPGEVLEHTWWGKISNQFSNSHCRQVVHTWIIQREQYLFPRLLLTTSDNSQTWIPLRNIITRSFMNIIEIIIFQKVLEDPDGKNWEYLSWEYTSEWKQINDRNRQHSEKFSSAKKKANALVSWEIYLEHNLFLCPLWYPLRVFGLLAQTWGPFLFVLLFPLCWVLCLIKFFTRVLMLYPTLEYLSL